MHLLRGDPPAYARKGDACIDLRWQPESADGAVQIAPGQCRVFATGIALAIPVGWEGQVRPRSGLGVAGITVANSPGTIDSGYRGEVKVALRNHGGTTHYVRPGDRIAQLAIRRAPHVELVLMGMLPGSERGSGGFGSTGR